MWKKTLFAFLLVLVCASVAWGQKTIVFAVDATWPPMEYVNQDKDIVGYSIDYMTAAGKLAGFEPVFKNTPWDGIFAGLQGGNYDAICSSVSITEKRKEAMDFSEPYYEVRQALIVPRDSDAETIQDLKGKKVGAQIGTTGYFAIKEVEGVEPESYDEIGLAMRDLKNGNLAGVVCDDPVAANYAKQKEGFQKNLQIVSILDTGQTEHYGIAVQKGNEDLLQLINEGISKVKEKGLEEKFKKKWIK
ncbi:MAG: basic amino acid ABC transporter substrate-binding protein [Desulfohalobiaceae bacterium]|nr:basic amino acid ABC transporter substrate-binding protein [Desulfohalobiaceae bacterium]